MTEFFAFDHEKVEKIDVVEVPHVILDPVVKVPLWKFLEPAPIGAKKFLY